MQVGADGKSVDLVGSEKMHFDYDSVIGPDGRQEDVYLASAKPVVDDFLEVSLLLRDAFVQRRTACACSLHMRMQPSYVHVACERDRPFLRTIRLTTCVWWRGDVAGIQWDNLLLRADGVGKDLHHGRRNRQRGQAWPLTSNGVLGV